MRAENQTEPDYTNRKNECSSEVAEKREGSKGPRWWEWNSTDGAKAALGDQKVLGSSGAA